MALRLSVTARVVVGSGLLAAAFACVPQPLPEDCIGAAITAARNETFVLDSGETTRPRDLTSSPIEVLIPRGAGGFTICPGSGASDGTLQVPDVPNVSYYLHVGQLYFVTKDRDLDLSIVTLGRPNVPPPPTNPTTVAVKVSGLELWNTTEDALQLFSMSARAFSFGPQVRASNPPTDADSALDFSLDWSKEQANLIQGSAGDTTFLTQLTQKFGDQGPYQSIERVLSTNSLTIRSGATSTLSGTLTAAPTPTPIATFMWSRSLFDAAATAAGTDGIEAFDELLVSAEPGGDTRGQYSTVPSLLFGLPFVGTFDTELSGYELSNPFPSTWTVLGLVSKVYTQSRTLSGASAGSFNTQVLVQDQLDRLTASTVTPLVGPVVALRFNGKSGYLDQSFSDESPEVSWSRPSPGPDQVQVAVAELQIGAGGATTGVVTALVSTGENKVRIPPGLLAFDKSYVFLVRAVVAPGADLAHHPTVSSIPFGAADVVSAVMTRTSTVTE